jgi:tRNA (cytidine/uridine-2'-O-)-methyltransferase
LFPGEFHIERAVKEQLLNVVLIEPEIGANTGNIGRTCVGLNAKLHLVGKLGFSITDRRLKRAGLDYWPHLDFVHHPDWETWWREVKSPERVFFFTTKSQLGIFVCNFRTGDWLFFGKETTGLDKSILDAFPTQTYRIPMTGPIRSLNVATAVAVVMFEGLRQIELAQCSVDRAPLQTLS